MPDGMVEVFFGKLGLSDLISDFGGGFSGCRNAGQKRDSCVCFLGRWRG